MYMCNRCNQRNKKDGEVLCEKCLSVLKSKEQAQSYYKQMQK